MASIYGISIYSAKTENWIAFSTTVEPLSSSTRSFKDVFDSKPGPGILGNDSNVYLWRKKNDIEVLFKLKKISCHQLYFNSVRSSFLTTVSLIVIFYTVTALGLKDLMAALL